MFLVDENGNRLSINGETCPGVTVSLTQDGYSGDCKACSDLSTSALPAPTYHNTTTYTDASGTYPAFDNGDGSTELALFDVQMVSDIWLQPANLRCFDLIAQTTHTSNFTPFSDGKYLHVVDNGSTWTVTGKLKANTSSVDQSVDVQVFLQKRNFSGGEPTTCDSMPYVATFKVIKP
jgi:hypothetical protein